MIGNPDTSTRRRWQPGRPRPLSSIQGRSGCLISSSRCLLPWGLALSGARSVGARVIELLIGNRYDPVWTIVASAALVAIAAVWMLSGFPIIALAIALYGAGNGIGSVARGSPRTVERTGRASEYPAAADHPPRVRVPLLPSRDQPRDARARRPLPVTPRPVTQPTVPAGDPFNVGAAEP